MFQYPKKAWALPCKYHNGNAIRSIDDTPVVPELRLAIGECNMLRFTVSTDKTINSYETLREAYVVFDTLLNDARELTATLTAADALEPLAHFDKRFIDDNGKKILLVRI